MSSRTPHRLLALATFTALPLLLLAVAPSAARSRFSGSATMNYTEQHPIPVTDADGHILLQTASAGTNRSTGATAFMDGAQVNNAELADLVQGTGTHQGYFTMSQNGVVVTNHWTGKVSTVLGADQKPVTTFQGTWTVVKGATGHGTYSGRLTGPASYTVDWSGEIDLKKQTSSP